VLVVALGGARPETARRCVGALADALRGDEAFLLVANGDFALDSFPRGAVAIPVPALPDARYAA
jgi:hypothetical protein